MKGTLYNSDLKKYIWKVNSGDGAMAYILVSFMLYSSTEKDLEG